MVMVEPFLTSLNSIISTPVSAARPTKNHPAFRFALRSAAQPMHYHELASSRAKRYKGKEKALPENDWLQCAEWLLGGNCRSRLFATHHPPHAAVSHSPLPQALSGSARNFASASKPAVVQHAEPTGPPPKSIISHFIYDKPFSDGARVELDLAYDAFMALRQQDDPWTKSTRNILRFMDRAVSTAEDSLDHFKDRDALRYWGDRLRALLSEGGSVASRSEEDFRRHCLLIRTFAMVQDLPRAMTAFRKFEELSDRYAGIKDVRFRMYRSLLLAHFHLYGVRGVLDFLAKEWTTAGQPLMGLTNAKSMNPRVKLFIDTTFYILDEIDSPISILFDRRDRDPTARARIGHILISWLLSRRCPEEALSVWESMERQSLECDLYVQMLVVRSLARNKARELGIMSYSRASQPFADSDLEERQQRAFLKTGLHITCHLGDVNRAETYFKDIQKRGFADTMDVAMLMHAFAVSGNAERAAEIFQEQFPDAPAGSVGRAPAVYHYTEVLLAHARARDIEGMNAWLEKMKSLGQPPDAYVWNVILHSFAERGELESALKLLDEMRSLGLHLNPADYTSVMGVFGSRKEPLSAEAIYKRAMQEGVKPDRRMIATLMRAHALAGSWRGVVRAFDFLKSSRVRQHRPQIDVYNILLKSYVHLGAPFSIVSDVFAKAEQSGIRPNTETFHLLIQAACDARDMETANSLLAQMDRLGKSGASTVAVNVFAMTIIMSGYLRLGDKVKAKQVYDDMVARGIKPSSVTYSAILKAYCRDENEDSIRIARDFLQVLIDTKHEERTWVPKNAPYSVALEQLHGPLISNFVRVGDPEEVEKVIQDMFNLGGEPSLATWTLLLKVYRRVGDIESVRAVWPNILEIAYHRPLAEARQQLPENSSHDDLLRRGNGTLCSPLSLYMDALSVAGYHNEVAEVWQKLHEEGFAFDVHNWNQLVIALVRAGDPERAFSMVEHVIIPSQRFEQDVPEERDMVVDSPLVFQEGQEPEKNEVKRSVYRLAAARLRRRAFDRRLQEHDPRFRPSDKSSDDPALSLFALSQISPLWMAWRAHRSTLRALLGALEQLRTGRLVQRVLRQDEMDVRDDDWEEQQRKAELAEASYGRICEECPETVALVEEFGRSEMARAERQAKQDIIVT
ncbi:hypothetical protein DENSPDRAFT_44179 [Dentipellis sp. KUC8613]|nr:hypothetical protein DENSPDRAFT_44179 [Dentipellis sp. KUC8613]